MDGDGYLNSFQIYYKGMSVSTYRKYEMDHFETKNQHRKNYRLV